MSEVIPPLIFYKYGSIGISFYVLNEHSLGFDFLRKFFFLVARTFFYGYVRQNPRFPSFVLVLVDRQHDRLLGPLVADPAEILRG